MPADPRGDAPGAGARAGECAGARHRAHAGVEASTLERARLARTGRGRAVFANDRLRRREIRQHLKLETQRRGTLETLYTPSGTSAGLAASRHSPSTSANNR